MIQFSIKSANEVFSWCFLTELHLLMISKLVFFVHFIMVTHEIIS